MKKIFKTLVIIFAMLFAVPTLACTQKMTGVITGGACSISELNNLERSKIKQGKMNSLPYGERYLRPVKIVPVMSKSNNDNCLFGMCLYRNILKESQTK